MTTFDKALTFTLDLEDHRPDTSLDKTYPYYTRLLLDNLDEHSIKGSFFVVGKISNDEPALIREIARRGHEIAFHSYQHQILDHETQEVFRNKTLAYKHELEDLSGMNVVGFRAPIFSLKPETIWVIDVLKELGFKYSSSVIPGKTVMHGFNGLPEHPFLWGNGLIEIPVPVLRLGTLVFPYLGGFYFRYIPLFIIRKLILRNKTNTLWFYCHPYDFADGERYFRMINTSHIVSMLLWLNRARCLGKLKRLISDPDIKFSKTSFSQQIEDGCYDCLDSVIPNS